MTALELSHLEQGSELWKQARVGLVTASRCADVIAMTKKGEGADRRNYRTELICEILTGQPYPRYVSQDMMWGRDQEPFARAAYELQNDVLVETCGFVLHPRVARFGASPDGLVEDDGMIQIKCPNTSTHLGWMLGGVVPSEHMAQMLAEMACTGRAWADFVSFDCRLPAHLQLFVKRFQRDDKFIAALESEVQHFNYELDEVLAALPQQPQPIAVILEMPRADELEF
jgi:YqaJ-like viral recombinase domain